MPPFGRIFAPINVRQGLWCILGVSAFGWVAAHFGMAAGLG